MSGELNRGIATDAAGFFQEQDKRLAMEERRSRVTKAADIMGPLLGPYAVPLDDSLNSDLLVFNGFFIVPPGTPESPDDTKWWMGESIASTTTGGVQILRTFQPADYPHTHMMRGWEPVPGGGRAYSDWQSIGPSPDPVVTGTLAGQNYYEKYDDGRLICAGTHSFPASAGTVQTLSWAYPVAFVGRLPMVTMTPQTTVPQNIDMGLNVPTLAGVDIKFIRTTASATTVFFQAEGRWK